MIEKLLKKYNIPGENPLLELYEKIKEEREDKFKDEDKLIKEVGEELRSIVLNETGYDFIFIPPDSLELIDTVRIKEILNELSIKGIDAEFFKDVGAVPFNKLNGIYIFLTDDIPNKEKLRKLSQKVPLYDVKLTFPHVVENIGKRIIDISFSTGVKREEEERIDIEDVKSSKTERKVQDILLSAMSKGASDIHFISEEREVRVKFRINGVLVDQTTLKKREGNAIINRIRLDANLDISKSDVPQSGSLPSVRGFDFRVESVGTIKGQYLVVRLLDKRKTESMTLDTLGFYPEQIKMIEKGINIPYGLILITGPTGSGKSTTLYSILKELNTGERNIITIENPVEYKFKGINQIQVNYAKKLDFAKFTRSTLRLDPDIIMVGEIRDEETAQAVIRAASTGHLVLSTLHTNDAASVVSRLVNLGIKPYQVADTLKMVISQRIVGIPCNHCSIKYILSEEEVNEFSIHLKRPKDDFKDIEARQRNPKGCVQCKYSGYMGRTIIAEILLIDADLANFIENHPDSVSIKEFIRSNYSKEKYFSIYEDALRKVKEGIKIPGYSERVFIDPSDALKIIRGGLE